MTGWPPARSLFGLHVDLGDYHTKQERWLHFPAAAFTCRWGCEDTASGPAAVAEFTQNITATHARTCPGPSGGTA